MFEALPTSTPFDEQETLPRYCRITGNGGTAQHDRCLHVETIVQAEISQLAALLILAL